MIYLIILLCFSLILPSYNLMNNLKKALSREDPRKYYKNKIEVSGLKRTGQWN